MKYHPNELTLYLDCTRSKHKKVKALAYTLSKNVREISLRHTRLSKLQWAEIIALLHTKPKSLMNKADPEYQQMLAGHDFTGDDWLEILCNYPCMLKGPIAIMGNHAVLCERAKDILKLAPQGAERF